MFIKNVDALNFYLIVKSIPVLDKNNCPVFHRCNSAGGDYRIGNG
jgi:hypothetical protein